MMSIDGLILFARADAPRGLPVSVPKSSAISTLAAALARQGGRGQHILITGARMATGTVKWFNTMKGFGFIQQDDGSKDAFVHARAVERAGLRHLTEGQKIEFDLVTDRRSGKQSAENLRFPG